MTQHPPFDYSVRFAKAIEVLQGFLEAFLQRPVSPLDIKMALSSYFEENCFAYAWNYLTMERDHDWHVVLLDPYFQEVFMFDENTLKSSAAEAYGWLLHNLDSKRVFPTHATRKDNGDVEFAVRGQRVATIARLRFSSVPREYAERVEKTFRGFRQYEEDPRLLSRMQSIPGLQGAMFPSVRARRLIGPALLRTPQNLCAQLKLMLTDHFRAELKQSQALELTARMFGAPSWNHFVAYSDREVCRLLPVALMDENDNPVFYRTAGEAIWAFGQRCKDVDPERPRNVRTMHIGEGPLIYLTNEPGTDWALTVLCLKDEEGVPVEYLAEGQRLHEADDVGAALLALFSDSEYASWTAANGRLGRPQRLKVGDWLPSPNPKHKMLQVEVQGELGRPGEPVRAWLHKCEFRVQGDIVRLLDEHGTKLVFKDRWSAEDRRRFAAFIEPPEEAVYAGEARPSLLH